MFQSSALYVPPYVIGNYRQLTINNQILNNYEQNLQNQQ